MDNNVTDTLSRIDAIGISVHHQTLAAAREKSNEMRDIITAGSYALQLKKVRFPDQEVGTHCDISTEIQLQYVPELLRHAQCILVATWTSPSGDTCYAKIVDDAVRLAVH
jgi:hypothetical protein